jgi:hypothetical protein
MTMPARHPFQLPTTVTIIFHPEKDGRVSAHALDFDIVATGENREDADSKICLAVRSYIEFGFLNGWAEDIRYPAPDEYWPPKGTELRVTGTIEILSRELLIYSASSIANEPSEASSLA